MDSDELPADITEFPASKAYRFLESGPVIFITTQPEARTFNEGGFSSPARTSKRRRVVGNSHDAPPANEDTNTRAEHTQDGPADSIPHANIMTCGFHMVVQHESPPLLSVIIGPWDTTYKTLQQTRECVIAVPPVSLSEKVVDIGNCSSSEVDKFAKFELTPIRLCPSPHSAKSGTRRKRSEQQSKIPAPLVKEALANFSCVVHDTAMVKKYNMWILRVVKAWVREPAEGEETRVFHHRGDGTFIVDGETINHQHRMVLWKEYQD